MEFQQPQSEFDASKFSNTIVASEPSPLMRISSSPQIKEKWWWQVGTQILVFLAQLPDYLGKLFNEYKQLSISVALILAAIITLRAVLAIIDALNDIPLLATTLELVGIGYSVWFVSRYLLRKSGRQELSQFIQGLLNE